MSSPGPQDELTSTVFGAIQALPASRKASFLLDTSLALIESGQYGDDVENYLEVYLKTPNLPREDVARALLARGKARKLAGDKLLEKAHQDFQAALNLDPSNRETQHLFRRDRRIHFVDEPASQRAPPEIWDRIARSMPRYHLRTWLFVSAFHREIAIRIIFRTVDLYFGDDQENVSRGLDFMDRVKEDPVFASQIKSLRIHWAYEESDVLDLMTRALRTALPKFTMLGDFEWIGYPEMRADVVQNVLASHSRIQSIGLIGWHFDAVGVSAFKNLHKFTLRAEDDDGFADMGEVRKVLDENEETLKHLILGAYLARTHSWDSTFQSVTIKNLTHLDLVDTRISHVVLARIAHAHNLQSLTLHGTFEEPTSASVVFASDHILEGKHTFLPHLEAFRFVLVGHDDELTLYQSVTQFLRKRTGLRKLDLGSCPWDLVLAVLPELTGLRVLGVRIANLNETAVQALVRSIPPYMHAIRLSTVVSDKSLNEHCGSFSKFPSLSFLHLHCAKQRPKPNLMCDKDFKVQTDIWNSLARSVAISLPSLDFVGWHGEHYVVVRNDDGVELKELPTRRRLDCGKGVDLGGEDAAWLERKDVPMDYEIPGLE
ncbi:uncharacterized protein BT62DRAFT_908730 [Guyanagaster necrorhizus]|uniref:Uncharacterized protein n=1 Tax=Guyanagaster necrorhizus TaxID=856835 RepID=A0A9P7VJ04_9AGAR|nr:uncharacterized protein BT62DRAFT_908730 [Guyanagaster necrorhizus MCA 3950]KAG7441240.1 hypothetical protein BT62DRAFT_908730 [Guyanagaster necrorhizus MCA 3950]